jgi:hypothetical protein
MRSAGAVLTSAVQPPILQEKRASPNKFPEHSFPRPAPVIPVTTVCLDSPQIISAVADCYPVLSRSIGHCVALPVSRLSCSIDRSTQTHSRIHFGHQHSLQTMCSHSLMRLSLECPRSQLLVLLLASHRNRIGLPPHAQIDSHSH